MRTPIAVAIGIVLGLLIIASGAFASDAATPEAPPEAIGEAALISASCSGCHTNSEMETSIPNLSSYTSDQIVTLLTQFQTDDSVTLMNRIARGYSADEIKTIADYLGKVEE